MLSKNIAIRAIAASTAVYATMIWSLEQHQSYSWSHVVGTAYAIVGGMSLAFGILTCVWPVVPERMFIGQVSGVFKSCGQWLRRYASDTATDPTSRAAFASASAKQLGLCRLWSRLISYKRLAPKSNETITGLIGAMQSTILHLIELEDSRRRWADTPLAEPLEDIGQRLNQQCSELVNGFVRALDLAKPIPNLPRADGTLDDLQARFDELRASVVRDEPSGKVARKMLEMAGQYAAFTNSITKCDAYLRKLDWRRLNQNYL